MVNANASFTGSIPDFYDTCLGPAWFNAFAADLAQRLSPNPPGDVLEIACGTGLMTEHARDRLDPRIRLVATDVSKAMLEYARAKLHDRNGIEWREADGAKLPFGDNAFGAVVCAFGIMFIPDKAAALREARRVLKPGGSLLFNVWDRIEENPHAAANARVFSKLFPGDKEMISTSPYEMYDPALLQRLLSEAGFREVSFATKRVQVDGVSARTIAIGHLRGSPRSLLLEKRGVPIEEVIELTAAAIAAVGGAEPYRASVQAVVVQAS
jgi:ubiquinone/menaquinone biosynthesis C-methylase UbiE